MNYSRIVGLISEIATWAPSSLFHLNIWILSTHVKQDYYSTMANMQYLKVLKAVEERKAQTTFSLKVALMLVKVTWRDNAGGSSGWYCAVLNLRKRVYPQVIILMSPHPLFFYTSMASVLFMLHKLRGQIGMALYTFWYIYCALQGLQFFWVISYFIFTTIKRTFILYKPYLNTKPKYLDVCW